MVDRGSLPLLVVGISKTANEKLYSIYMNFSVFNGGFQPQKLVSNGFETLMFVMI